MFKKFFILGILMLVITFTAGTAYSKNIPSITMLSTRNAPLTSQMERTLKELRAKFPGKVLTINVDLEDNPDIAKKYNVRYIPTLIFRNSNGKDIAQVIGYKTLDEVLATFSESGIRF